MEKKPINAVFAIAALLISAIFFKVALDSDLPLLAKVALAVADLAACGYAVSFAFKFECWGGAFLLKSQHGLEFLDSLAKKHSRAFQLLADVGLVIGYGSFAYFLLPKQKRRDWKGTLITYGAGTFLLVVASSLLPLAISILLSMMSGGSEFATAGARFRAAASGIDVVKFASLAFMVVGGIALVTTASILTYAGIVLSALAQALLGNAVPLAQTPPGGMPLLPGINLDFFQGIIALAVVLAVHEAMHGILARLYRLPLKSAGLAFFGFFPIGAFVDIDEKKLFSEPKERQNAVLVAGTTANFLAGILLLLLLIGFAMLFGGQGAWASYVARLLGLTFSLNIIVASMNLVPLPLFDGYHIMRNGVADTRLQKAIVYAVAASFLLTLSPWLLR